MILQMWRKPLIAASVTWEWITVGSQCLKEVEQKALLTPISVDLYLMHCTF